MTNKQSQELAAALKHTREQQPGVQVSMRVSAAVGA